MSTNDPDQAGYGQPPPGQPEPIQPAPHVGYGAESTAPPPTGYAPAQPTPAPGTAGGSGRTKLGVYQIGVLAVFVLYLIAVLLPWAHASATNFIGGATLSDDVNGFHYYPPRVGFILFLFGAAWALLPALGIPFRRNISRSFVALVDVGLPGVLAIVGFFVAKSDVNEEIADIPGISVEADLSAGAYLGIVVGLAAIALAVLMLLADRKAQMQAGSGSPFGGGPIPDAPPASPQPTWAPPAGTPAQQAPFAEPPPASSYPPPPPNQPAPNQPAPNQPPPAP